MAAVAVSGCAKSPRTSPRRNVMERQQRQGAAAYTHYLTGTMLEKQGRYDEALEEIRKAAELSPESQTLTLRLVRAYLRQEDYANALTMAERAAVQIPDNANIHIVLGEIYHRLGRYDDAVEVFNKAIQLDPGNMLGYGALVSLEESTNDLIAATDIYHRLAEMSPNSARVHLQLGLCYAKMNDPVQARNSLQKALNMDSSLLRAQYVLGVLEVDAGDLESGRTHFEQYLAQQPEDARARESLAGVLARLGHGSEAAAQLEQAMKAPTAEPRMALELMFLSLRQGAFDRVATMSAPQEAPLLGLLFRAIALQESGGAFKPVAASLDGTEGEISGECDAFLNEVLYLFGKKEAGEYLLGALQKLRVEAGASRTIGFVEGRVLIGLERYAEAESAAQASLAAMGPSCGVHYLLAIIYENLKDVAKTEFHLKEYLKITPDNPDILNFLGYLYADHNFKLDEAEVLLQRALALVPNNGYYMDSLGWVYYRRGDADKAIEYIQKAILAMDNDDSELRNHLGDAYLLKGDIEKALAQWRRAQRLNPKLEGIAEKIQQHETAPAAK